MKYLVKSLFAIFCTLLCNSVQAGPFDELIINGGFENTVVGNNRQIVADPNTARYTQLDSWTTSSDTAKLTFLFGPNAGDTTGARGLYYDTTPFTLWGPSNGGTGPSGVGATAFGPSPLGGNYIAMDGDSRYNVPLSQTVNGLLVGQKYNVSFYWGAAQQRGFDGATTEKWDVTLGTQTLSTPIFSLASHAYSGWMPKTTLVFTATATSAVLSFLAVGTPNGLPPFALLDGVSVIAVPEPSMIGLILVALVGFAVLRRNRKKVVRS